MKDMCNSGFSTWLAVANAVFFTTLLTACGTFTHSEQAGSVDAKPTLATDLNVRGTIVQHDGITPLAGATVSVLNETGTINNATLLSATQHCKLHATASPEQTNTKADGSFVLNLESVKDFPVSICIEKQDVAQELILNVNDINTDIGTIKMRSTSRENKEKVAIVMDFYNLYDDIIRKIQSKSPNAQNVEILIKSQYQNIYNIDVEQTYVTYPKFFSLFVDADKDGKADIHNYDSVYINSRSESDIALLDNKIKRNLLRYISSGGNLFITEWNIELNEEPALDQYI